MKNKNKDIKEIVNKILDDYQGGRDIDQIEIFDQPDTKLVQQMINKLLTVVFPGFFREQHYRFYNMDNRLTALIEDVMFNLNKQIAIALLQREDMKDASEDERLEEAQKISLEFFDRIPKVREYVDTDVEAGILRQDCPDLRHGLSCLCRRTGGRLPAAPLRWRARTVSAFSCHKLRRRHDGLCAVRAPVSRADAYFRDGGHRADPERFHDFPDHHAGGEFRKSQCPCAGKERRHQSRADRLAAGRAARRHRGGEGGSGFLCRNGGFRCHFLHHRAGIRADPGDCRV